MREGKKGLFVLLNKPFLLYLFIYSIHLFIYVSPTLYLELLGGR